MKKFGFGKKSDESEDANRNALFGSKKKTSASPASENPYANQGASDPYADQAKYANVSHYQQQRNNTSLAGNAYGSTSPGPMGGSYGAPSAPSGYGADRYGSGGGYGSQKYDTQPGQGASSTGARGPGGYGGFGRAVDTPDGNRDALFAGARERLEQKQQSGAAPVSSYDPAGQSGASGGAYGGYGEQRELTAEEQEEADVQSILAEKKEIQQESVASVTRSVLMARQANEIGRATLERLGAQGERLHNTEKNLDLAANQNKIAQDRAAELKTLNRSMFAVHVGNPFTSKQRQLRADEAVLARHREERDAREATRRDGYAANQRVTTNMRQIDHTKTSRQTRKKDYGKFNLEDEEGADELEDQIDEGLTELEGQVKMMNMVGRAIGQEVDCQNNQIERIMNKSDAVDDATRMNRERLARIR